jgi:hypothetical protein
MSEKNGVSVGTVAEIKGHATVVHLDGTQETMTKGLSVFAGDIIETDAAGAVNITFNDNTVFAVSNNAKMTIDEFVYDPNKDGEGQADVSVVRGVFVYTSGFVGKEDHNDVHIKTPVGSIGIRGTTLTGYIPEEGSPDSPKISLIEGAIVVQPNQGAEIFLDESRETVQLNAAGTQAENVGVITPQQMLETFNVVRTVAPALFTPVTDAAGNAPAAPQNSGEGGTEPPQDTQATPAGETGEPSSQTEAAPATESAPPQPVSGEVPVPEGAEPPMKLSLLEQNLAPDAPFDSFMAPLAPPPNFLDFGMMVGPALPPPPPLFKPFLPPLGGEPVFLAPINHAPIATTGVFTAFEQAGLEGGFQTMDSSRFFRDPDGNPLTYVITGINDPNGVIQNAFINSKNEIAFQIKSVISADSDVHIFVAANDGKLSSSSVDFSFHVYDLNPAPGSYTLGNDTNTLFSVSNFRFSMKAGDDSLSIDPSSSGNVVFSDLGDDTVYIQSNNNKVFGEEGNDFLKIFGAGTGNLISGGSGQDTLRLEATGAGSQAFGGDGNDLVILSNAAAVSQINSNDLLIDAGSGFDTLLLAAGGAGLDLTLVNQNTLHSIEKIKSDTGTPDITLDIKDIVEHTDGGFLFIQNVGSLNVGNAFSMNALTLKNSGVTNPYDAADGSTYNVYSNGAQTLYVDQSIASVTGL